MCKQFTDDELSILFQGLLRFEDTLKRSLAKNLQESVLRDHYEQRMREVLGLKARISLLIQGM